MSETDTVTRTVERRGDFEIRLGVPEGYEGHRCEYARETVKNTLGEKIVKAWIIQRTIPCDPPYSDPNKTYYKFGGNLKLERVE